MTFNFAICDDENKELEYLSSIIVDWCAATSNTPQVSRFTSAESFLFDYEENKSYDILLLDIQMRELDGIALAEKLRRVDSRVQIIFITGFDEYMDKGYDVNALHYLLKPVKKEKLFEVLDRAAKILQKEESYCVFEAENEIEKVAVSDILYVEAFGHSCEVVTKGGTFKVNRSISEIHKTLGKNFVFCHRSFLVNLANVSKITKTEIYLDTGKSVPLSRRLYGKINEEFIKFYREKK